MPHLHVLSRLTFRKKNLCGATNNILNFNFVQIGKISLILNTKKLVLVNADLLRFMFVRWRKHMWVRRSVNNLISFINLRFLPFFFKLLYWYF